MTNGAGPSTPTGCVVGSAPKGKLFRNTCSGSGVDVVAGAGACNGVGAAGVGVAGVGTAGVGSVLVVDGGLTLDELSNKWNRCSELKSIYNEDKYLPRSNEIE